MRGATMKRRRCQVAEEEDDDEAEVRREGTTVYFYADVRKDTVLKLLRCLREATAAALVHDDPPPVRLYLHSDGGCAFAGLSAHDHISRNRVPVTTVADGMVASAASVMLLAGHRRLALPHSFVLIHQLSLGFVGKYADMLDEVQNSSALMRAFTDIYTARTSMTAKRVEQLLKKERAIDAQQCLLEGFVDEVL